MIKAQLVDLYKDVSKKYTYVEICNLTKLSSSQIASVLKHDGSKVSVEKMEKGLLGLGISLQVTVSKIER